MSSRVLKSKKYFQVFLTGLLAFSLSSCGAMGSKFTAADMEACRVHWDDTSRAVGAAPRATYSETAPDPTTLELNRFFNGLSSLSVTLRDQAKLVTDAKLGKLLVDFSSAVTDMSSDYQDDIRSRGTSGITLFNSKFEAVTQYCEDHGWKKD